MKVFSNLYNLCYFFLFLFNIAAKIFAIAKLTMQQNTVKLIKERKKFGLLTMYCPIKAEYT